VDYRIYLRLLNWCSYKNIIFLHCDSFVSYTIMI
jgi:hypothetical protein